MKLSTDASTLADWYWKKLAPGLVLDESPARRWLAARILRLFGEFGIDRALSRPSSLESLARGAGIVEEAKPSLDWMLRVLLQERLVELRGKRWRLRAAPRPAGRERLNASARRLARWLGGFMARFPAFWRGRAGGPRIVLIDEAGRWREAFRLRVLGGADNELLARALAVIGPGESLLELGCGTGGGTRAIASALKNVPRIHLVVSDAGRGFVDACVEQGRRTSPGLKVEGRVLDITKDWSRQGVAAGEFDAVLGANVLHVARDVAAVLREVRRALKPSGWLLLAEHRRRAPAEPLLVELPNMMLRGYWGSSRAHWSRHEYGFRTLEQWKEAFKGSGFKAVMLPKESGATVVLIAARPGPFGPGTAARQRNRLVAARPSGRRRRPRSGR